MADSSEIGRFGTLRLLKRHDPETTIAFFPIDDEEVSFGRSKDCSIRLYYDCISELHCTLRISEERKAFLTVHGTNGIIVDGCEVKPTKTEGSNSMTVPLTNGSEIEIYRKRFRFEYPPKEIRAALLATPRDPRRRRSLRMSMIQSAQVFTPRVNTKNYSRTPRRGSISDNADWQALRTPVKIPSNDSSPREMMLLEGNGEDALVVEEEKDLIILEHVDDSNAKPKPSQSQPQFQIPSKNVTFSFSPGAHPSPPIPMAPLSPVRGRPLQTPTNRRKSGLSLHKAVILRSAQRVQLERDREREREQYEEEQEEQEVELAISPERELGPFELHAAENDDEDEDEDEDGENNEEDLHSVSSNFGMQTPLRVLKAGLHMVKRITIDRLSPESIPLPEDGDGDNDEMEDKEPNDHYEADEDTVQSQTPIRRNLGPFMTPQVAFKPAQRVPIDVKPRASVGGESFAPHLFGGPRRVPVDEAWKLNDIVLPDQQRFQTDKQGHRLKITEEERQAILQRRKSALQIPSNLPSPGPRNTLLDQSEVYTPGEDMHEDTETMLERMREKMDHVRRKSEARKARLSLSTPHKQQKQSFSLLPIGSARSDKIFPTSRISEEMYSQTKAANEDHDCVNQATIASSATPISHTPRFDGIREMFKQPAVEPKTPSFTGFKEMFGGVARPDLPPKTPSFVGIRKMFNQYPAGVLATPHMNLNEVFEQDGDDGDHEREEPSPIEEEGPSPKDRWPAARTSSSDAVAVEAPNEVLEKVGPVPAPPTRKERRTMKTLERDVESDESENIIAATKATRKTARGSSDDPPKRIAAKRTIKTKKVVTSGEGQGTVTARPRGRRTKKQVEEEAVQAEEAEEEAMPEEISTAPKTRRGRRGKMPTSQPVEELAATKVARRPKVEPVDNVDSLATVAPKPVRQGRRVKAQLATVEEMHFTDTEEVNSAPKTRGARKDTAAGKAAPLHETQEENKENSEDQAVAVGKAAGKATRVRKAVGAVEAEEIPVAAPARRTRSRK